LILPVPPRILLTH